MYYYGFNQSRKMRNKRCLLQWSGRFIHRRCASNDIGGEKAKERLSLEHFSTFSDARELESAVGYPTPLFSLRHLLTADLLRLSADVRSLLQSRHPIVKTAKFLLGSGTLHSQGLTILLVSKLFNTLLIEQPETEEKRQDQFGIISSQRALTEIAEIIHSAYIIHLGIVNSKKSSGEEELHKNDGGNDGIAEEDMLLGNKVAILGGDYLLAKACTGLAQLQNNQVVGLVSDAIADMMEGYFLRLWLNSQQPSQETEDTHMEMLQKLLAAKPQLKQTLSLDCNSVNPSHTLDLCTHYLCHGCLLGRSCEAAALVAGIPVPLFPMMSLLSHSIAMAVLWNLPLLRDQVGASTGHYYRIRALERLESFRDSNAKTLLQNYIASGGIMS